MRRAIRTGLIVALPLLLSLAVWYYLTRAEPFRLPELYGTVVAIEPDSHGQTKVLVRCREPERPDWESDQNRYQRTYSPLIYASVGERTPIHRRGGGAGEVAVGQTVSVWCSGGMLTTHPGIWGADFVVVEAEP